MSLQKQNIPINFSLGLDLKTDPFQLAPGRFLSLTNSVFTKGGLLQKRNGFPNITEVPEEFEATTLTTFKGNLTAIGNNIVSFSQASNEWEARGRISPIALSVQSLIRSTYSQTAPDVAISYNNVACTVFLDGDGNYKYQISDYATGQTLIGITNLPAGATQARVFSLNTHFLLTYLINSGGPKLQYIAIPVNNLDTPASPVNISAQVSGTTAGWDGYVTNNTLYVAWDGNDGGGAIRVTRINANLVQFATKVNSGHTSSRMSVTSDVTGNSPIIWVTAYDANNAYSYAFDASLNTVLPATHTITATVTEQITSTASDMVLHLFYQVHNTYSYSGVRTDFIRSVTCTQAGVVGTPAIVARSVGLASEAFMIGDTSYMLSVYPGAFQPTYFLIDSLGNVVGKLAYSNGAGYASTQVLPSVTVTGNMAQMGYLLKDLIAPVNKSMDAPAVNNIYSQTGVNVVTFNFAMTNVSNVEIGNNLIIAGAITWLYDGVKPVELGFNLWAEDILLTPQNIGGSMSEQEYFYQVVYEWTDGQGNIHRAAPSIPQSVTLAAGQDAVHLDIPTLRLTYKTTPNAVRIVIYRWSTAQQNFYQVTSITSPLLNNPAVDSVAYVDQAADNAIIGNTLIYTTGGVVENIAPPGTSILMLYASRVFLVDDENPDSVWYSKQVIQATPVEMSDLFTMFIAPTSGAQGSTGPITAGSPMDDKLIFFKADAGYYINGKGPDDTGAQNDFSDPIFITSTVGTTNQNSIGFIPQGLTFQSNKGIWLLQRNLSTQYVGAAVENFNNDVITSTAVIPGTNQLRYSIETGVSACIYNGKHTILNSAYKVMQETSGTYIDGNGGQMLMYDYFFDQWGTFNLASGPVLLSFNTGWINMTGLQGFERAYFFNLLGSYLSPHKLSINVAYDYNSSATQSVLIAPGLNTEVYGGSPLYGDQSPYGGPGSLEQWRVFFKKQKCQAFQLQVAEVYDNSFGGVPGAGLTLSGINLTVGAKNTYPRLPAAQQVG